MRPPLSLTGPFDRAWSDFSCLSDAGKTELSIALSSSGPNAHRASWRLFVEPGRARVAAIASRELSVEGAPMGQLGYIEARDVESARRVIECAMDWLTTGGCRRVVGPLNFSAFSGYRLRVDRATRASFFGEPLHSEAVHAALLSLGFGERRRWVSLEATAGALAESSTGEGQAQRDSLKRRGITLRALTQPLDDAQLNHLKWLFDVTFAGQDCYRPFPAPVFRDRLARLQASSAGELTLVAEDAAHRVVGYLIGVPSGPRAVALYEGVEPKLQGMGLGLALAAAFDARARALGFQHLLYALLAEDSAAHRLVPRCAEERGVYLLFERRLT